MLGKDRVGKEIEKRMLDIQNRHAKFCTAAQAKQQRTLEEKNLERMKANGKRRTYMLRSLERFAKLSSLSRSESCKRVRFNKVGVNDEKGIYAYINVHKEGEGINMTKAELLDILIDEHCEHPSTTYVYVNVGRSNLKTDDNLRTYLFDILANPDENEGRGIVLSVSTVTASTKLSSKYNSNFCDLLLKVIFDRF